MHGGPGMAWGMVDRVGGPDRLRALVEKFYQRMSQDSIIGFFFAGRDLQKIIDGQTAFLMRRFGAVKRYRGRPPTVAHVSLPPIRRGQFDRRMQILRETLTDEGLPAEDVEAWVKVEEGFRGRLQMKPESPPGDEA